VTSVNGLTGNVVLDGTNVMYDNAAKISLNTKIDNNNDSALHISGNENITGIKTIVDTGLLTTQGNGRIQANFTPSVGADVTNKTYVDNAIISGLVESVIYKTTNVHVNYKDKTVRQ
jgi:hypothetical protein